MHLRTTTTVPTTPDRPARSRGLEMISPGPVTPVRGKTRKLTVKASDPFSDAAVKGSPPETPDSMGTTLVLSPNPKKATKSNLAAASIASPKSNVNPKSQAPDDSQEDNSGNDSDSESQSELGTLVEVASTDSDTNLAERDRLRARKAALYVEWRDYYNHQKSFGKHVHADTLQMYTSDGLIHAGWQQNPGNGHWHKPGASKVATVARAGSKKPKDSWVWMKKSTSTKKTQKPAKNAKEAKAMKAAISMKAKKKIMHNSVNKVKKTIDKNKVRKHGGASVSHPKAKISGKRIGKSMKVKK